MDIEKSDDGTIRFTVEHDFDASALTLDLLPALAAALGYVFSYEDNGDATATMVLRKKP